MRHGGSDLAVARKTWFPSRPDFTGIPCAGLAGAALAPLSGDAANVFQTDLSSITSSGSAGVLRAGSIWAPACPSPPRSRCSASASPDLDFRGVAGIEFVRRPDKPAAAGFVFFVLTNPAAPDSAELRRANARLDFAMACWPILDPLARYRLARRQGARRSGGADGVGTRQALH